MNQKYLFFNVLLAMTFFLSACNPPVTTSQVLPSQTQPGPTKAPQTTISEWSATPPLTVTPPYTAEVEAEAAQAFSNGAMVFFYDPQPATVSLSDLEKTTFSVRYILSNDAMEVTNILLLWKVNAGGIREFIIPETSDVLA